MPLFIKPVIFLLLVFLNGCAGKDLGLNRYIKTETYSKKQNARSAKIFSRITRVRIEPGDTVYSIARRHGITIRDLILKNGLVAPYKILAGQTLLIPIPERHIVVTGDTVFALSNKYKVDMRTLVELNTLKPPYQLKKGQVLKIPNSSSRVGVGSKRNIRNVLTSRSEIVFSPFPRPKPVSNPRRERARVHHQNSPISKPLDRGGKYFLWPVRGTVISRFGPRRGGLHNDGINIAAPRGAPVFAAENGVVAYTGNGIKGFGNLLLVKHSGGWTTAYAHVDRVLVKRGDRVKRGETIGTIGTSGKVNKPQLHFEIRKGSQAVDPMRELAT